MLDELFVEDLALIERADLQFSSGLTVLSGETGAGKSALLSALRLLMGDRASTESIRQGCESLRIQARIYDGMTEDGASEAPEDHIATRIVGVDGKSRCTFDGAMVSVSQLGRDAGARIDLCGQQDHQKLLRSANHLTYLDAWGAEVIESALSDYVCAWDAYQAAKYELDDLECRVGKAAAQREEAAYVVECFDQVKPQPAEFEDLKTTLVRMEHASSLAEGAHEAYLSLNKDGYAIDLVNRALSQVISIAEYDPYLDGLVEQLRAALDPLQDCASALRRYRDGIDFDPAELEAANERMHELSHLARLYGPDMDTVFERYAKAKEILTLAQNSREQLRAARLRLGAADERLGECAKALSEARAQTGPAFAREVSERMQTLEMTGCSLSVRLSVRDREHWGPTGADSVEFLYSPGVSIQPRPLEKIASGGELSRVMLAIKVVLGSHDEVDTLIFDEIDEGVGGATARALGAVLADLARTHQVIVVTHLAQIAILADKHYVVRKVFDSDTLTPHTCIEPVSGDDRVREIARLLSGDEEAATIEHARDLLDKAGTF